MSINTPRSLRSFFLSIRLRHKLIILVYEFLDMSWICLLLLPSLDQVHVTEPLLGTQLSQVSGARL